MILSLNIFLLSSAIISVKGSQLNHIELSKVSTVFTLPFCYEKAPRSKRHAGILDSNTVIVLMALLALATVLTQ